MAWVEPYLPPKNSFLYYKQVVKGKNASEVREKTLLETTAHHISYNNNIIRRKRVAARNSHRRQWVSRSWNVWQFHRLQPPAHPGVPSSFESRSQSRSSSPRPLAFSLTNNPDLISGNPKFPTQFWENKSTKLVGISIRNFSSKFNRSFLFSLGLVQRGWTKISPRVWCNI